MSWTQATLVCMFWQVFCWRKIFLGLWGPLVLFLVGPPVRPSARKNFFSFFFSSLPSFCPVTPGTPVTLVSPPSPGCCCWCCCCWSFGGASLLKMIIRRGRPLANDHPEGPTSCKWSSGGAVLMQMIICHPLHLSQLCQDPYSISRTFLEQFVLVECKMVVF